MDKAIYGRGMAMRRTVLGDDYVDRAIANTTDFDRQFQEQLTERAWGAVWGDAALKPRDRGILNLGMIASLGKMHESRPISGARCAMASPKRNPAPFCARSRSIGAFRPRLTPTAWPRRCWRSKPSPDFAVWG